ncbi:MAG TPA: GNAT family N-acetyltransferase [Mesorhizobium sp.]|jgi:GNAT superfamily N-acetyltransferase|uniref:GNAT family N-acetyltransferase n=1 Tax=Mesorhizobium sp. TaxID=1871066 RepID=UPI002DDCA2DB|nr:GNAT family N-acetyltransferase [Mesorhizobium sp.]HEV2506539.1 GNAT family N-acetyltransferase [Mesorhizobium sp.]
MSEAADSNLEFHPLDREQHGGAVAAFYERAGDYALMERGQTPDAASVQDFFEDCPPGCDPASSFKLACFDGQDAIIGIADMAFGFPETSDAYIGLLLIGPWMRGRGLGRRFLHHLVREARARRCRRMLVAVLDVNKRGRSFWEREGFVLEKTFEPRHIGSKNHVLYRLVRPL